MSEGVVIINQRLTDNYGKDVYLDKPRYRIVYSTSQIEKRYGTFEDETEGGIYLRTVTEVRECPKYPAYPDMWVLEYLQPNMVNPELKTNWSYEPLWIFGANGTERQPVWDMVNHAVHAHKFVEKVKLSPGDLAKQEEERFLKEKSKFREMLDDASPFLASQLKDGHAVSYSGLDGTSKKENDNGGN